MRHYETTYILRPNLGESQFNEVIDRINGIISEFGGALVSLDRWGLKKLAYTIKKEAQGYYVYVNYAAPGETITEIERVFRIDDRVMRYLTVKLSDSIDDAGIVAEKERIAAAAAAARAAREAEEAAQEAAIKSGKRTFADDDDESDEDIDSVDRADDSDDE